MRRNAILPRAACWVRSRWCWRGRQVRSPVRATRAWSPCSTSSCGTCGGPRPTSSRSGLTRCTSDTSPKSAPRFPRGNLRHRRLQRMGEAITNDRGGEETSMPYRVTRYRLLLVKDGSVPTTWDRQLRQSRDVAGLMAGVVAGLDREVFYVLLVDGKNRVAGINLVSVGSLSAALVHPREVFKAAIAGSAAALVLVHNHPSGDPSPSPEDRAVTERLVQVGELVGIKVLDHIVLGEAGTFRSFADEGLLGGAR